MKKLSEPQTASRYILQLNVLRGSAAIDITQEEFDALKVAWDAIYLLSNIEEEWDTLIQNYVELETELLKSAVCLTVLHDRESFNDFLEVRRLFSRRMSNLLQSCRAYLDHTPHHLGKLNVTGTTELFKLATNKAYDSEFSYRFMEELRNYAQHRGVPMHGTSFSATWIEGNGNQKDLSRYSVAGRVDVDAIREDQRFKKAVLDEIAPDVRYLDVATLTREYLESLSSVHEALRLALRDCFSGWKVIVANTIARYAAVNDGRTLGLMAKKLSEKGEVETKFSIFEDLPNYIDALMRRNRSLINLRFRYASGEPTRPKQPNPRKTSDPSSLRQR